MTRESWIPKPSSPTPMDTSENNRNTHIKEELVVVVVKKMCMTNKKYLFFLCYFYSKDYPRCPSWTLDFAPAFLQRFSFPLSPRSIFHTGQRFLLPNHVTSGCMSPRSFFPPGQRFPLLKHVISGSGYDVIFTSKRGQVAHTSVLYYSPNVKGTEKVIITKNNRKLLKVKCASCGKMKSSFLPGN